uniref:Gypsy retrotransposon integrase-like protein 1 n=1 Tax=Salarias fasciatus TaxID=181472 RepID=A0A672G032_SALFA
MAAKTLFYEALRQFKTFNKITVDISKHERKRLLRIEANFILKDGQLFYTGPRRQYMRLVVQSEEQKQAVLQECHGHPGTGNHSGVRGTRDRVTAGYYWSTISEDVKDWVKRCRQCQLNDKIKTASPALRPIKVNEPWEVVGMDLIGPLQETTQKNQYILTMTDLHSTWVVAEALQTKSAAEVAAAVVNKLYLFGMVRKIITDQGREFVDMLNTKIFEALNIKQAVSSAYHPHTNGQDERTNQNIKRALRKYVNEEHNDWDVHLQAIVYGINTAEQRSTGYSPHYRFFHRHPRLPEEVGDPEDDPERTLTAVKALNKKFCSNIERAQEQQKKAFSGRKRKRARTCHLEAGDKVLIEQHPKKIKLEPTLQTTHEENQQPKTENLVDHSYAASATLMEHQY